MALVVVPWVVRNKVSEGHAVVSTISDEVLFWRVFDGERPLPFVGNDPETNMVRRLYARSRAAGAAGQVNVWYVHELLDDRGYTYHGAGVRQREMALRAIGAAPLTFARDSLDHLGDYARTPAGGITDDSVAQIAPAHARVAAAAPSVVQPLEAVSWRTLRSASLLTTAWWFLSVCGLTGLLVVLSRDGPRRAAAITFASAWVVMGVALALTGLPELRYNAVGVPVLWVVGSAGLVVVAQTVVRRLGERRRSTAPP
jgi:hypothetical protein